MGPPPWTLANSPEMHADGTVSFRIRAPEASEVNLESELLDGKPSLLTKGDEADFFSARDVPHGSVHQHFYHSSSIGSERSFHIYTPPDYYINTDKKYPVLFLLHGSGETDASWVNMGKANVILDNLIAQGLAASMLVIMPYGHTVEPGTSGWPFVQEKGDFIQDLFEDLLPYAENLYRISAQSKDRAVAGFSMGAYHTLLIGLNHLDQFDYLGVFSWGAG